MHLNEFMKYIFVLMARPTNPTLFSLCTQCHISINQNLGQSVLMTLAFSFTATTSPHCSHIFCTGGLSGFITFMCKPGTQLAASQLPPGMESFG